MKIISSYLKGFVPLSLSSIKEISIEFPSDIHLILGRNGCGKSNLLREHTLFPAIHTNYTNDGVKIIKAEDNGNIYETISILGKTNKHTFIKNGEVILNEVNPTVLREKIIEEFKYTPYIHKLLMGDIKFTAMSSTAKRELLQLISPLNLDYALKLHSDVKDKLKETQVIVNHLSDKLSYTQTKLIKLNIPDNVIETQEVLNNKLRNLLPFTINTLPNVNEILSKLNNLKNHFENIPKIYKQYDDIELKYLSCTSNEELSEYIGQVTTQIETAHSSIINLSENINKLNSVLNDLTETNLSPEELKDSIDTISRVLLTMDKTLVLPFNSSKLSIYSENLDILKEQIESIYTLCFSIIIRSIEDINNIENSLDSVNYKLNIKTAELGRLESHLKHLEKEEIICANCKVSLTSSGNSKEEQILKISTDITSLEITIKELNKNKEELTEQLREITLQREAIRKIESLYKQLDLPKEIWYELQNPINIIKNKIIVFSIINKWKEKVSSSIKYNDLEKELKKYTTALESYSLLGGNSETKLTEYNIQISILIEKKQDLEIKLKHAKLYLKKVQFFKEGLLALKEQVKEYTKYLETYADILIQEDARIKQNKIHLELGEINHQVNQKDLLINQINSLQNEVSEYKKDLEALLILEKNLSHNKGIIAEQMNKFMLTFVNEINNVINSIWEYTIEILPCSMDNGNLSYVFPFKVEDSLVPDTNFASTSQADIINLAFVMVVRQYLNLTNFPMYMDETGSGFDEAHRECLLNYIKEVVNNQLCSQLFVINHYSHVYGGLANHSAIVLNPNGITVPEKYNEEVTIVYY